MSLLTWLRNGTKYFNFINHSIKKDNILYELISYKILWTNDPEIRFTINYYPNDDIGIITYRNIKFSDRTFLLKDYEKFIRKYKLDKLNGNKKKGDDDLYTKS